MSAKRPETHRRRLAALIKVSAPAPTEEVLAFAEATAADNARLLRVIQEREDRLAVLEDYVHTVDDLLANPEMSATDKIVVLATTREVHTRLSKGKQHIALGRLADLTGLHKNTVSKAVERNSSDDADAGAPFRKKLTRTWVADDGPEGGHWESTITVIPWKDRPRDTLAVAAAYGPPKPNGKRGGSPQAAEARWKRFEPCDAHRDANIALRGSCVVCDGVVGERIVRPEECEALNHTLGDPDYGQPPTVSIGTKGHTLGDSDARPVPLLDYVSASDLDPPTWVAEWPDGPPAQPAPVMLCTCCPEPLLPGDQICCAAHRAEADLVAMPWEPVPAVAGGSE